MFDAVIIGAGPAGYTCALSVAANGGKACIVEKNGLGGTCTQRGCIPTKYLHSMADIIRRVKNAKKHGINSSIELNYTEMKNGMQKSVSKLADGIKMLLEKKNVEIIHGTAVIKSANEVIVDGKILSAKNIVIATGSSPICLPEQRFGGKILSSDSIFEIETIPKSVVVVGGGYSGCEFSAIFNELGCKVWLVEMEKRLLPTIPEKIGKTVEKYMKLDGINVMAGSKVEKIDRDSVYVNGEKIQAEKILLCIGRKANINSDELKNIGIDHDDKYIIVDEKMQTSIPNIYAIGDVTGKFELAHVAAKQGKVAADNIMGKNSTIDYSAIPMCVFTFPEVAFVGNCEGQGKSFPLVASAKATCLSETRGFIDVFEENGTISGVIIVGPHAGEVLGEATLAVKQKMKCSEIIDTIHAHPTLSEAFVDATRMTEEKSIHI